MFWDGSTRRLLTWDLREGPLAHGDADLRASARTHNLAGIREGRSPRRPCCLGERQKHEVRARLILESGASGLSVGARVTQEARNGVRKEDGVGEVGHAAAAGVPWETLHAATQTPFAVSGEGRQTTPSGDRLSELC